LSRIKECNQTENPDQIKYQTCFKPYVLKCEDDSFRLSISTAIYGLKDYEICPTDASIFSNRRICDEILTATDIIKSK
jgi:hypothetical protein